MQNRQALYLLLSANMISHFAQGISMLAIPWYFIDILEKGSIFGAIYAITTFFSLFWSIYAGTLIDRYPRKNIFLVVSTIGMLFLGSVSFTGFAMGEIPLILVGLVFSFTMFNYQIHYPALYAFGQELTERKYYGKTNSLLEIQGQFTNVLAGAFAAMLLSGISVDSLQFIGIDKLPFTIEAWPLHQIFLLDAFTYLIAISIILFIKYSPVKKYEIETGNIRQRLKTGINFLKSNPSLFIFGNASYSLFVVLLIELHLLLPMYVDNHLDRGAGIYGIAEVLYALGALSAGIWIRKIFFNTNYVKAIMILMVAGSILFIVCYGTRSITIFLLFNLCIGLCNAGTRVMRVTYLFSHIPNNVIGRASSVFQMINIILRFSFISLFSIPFFTTANNVIWAYLISGIFILISVLPLLWKYKVLVETEELK